MKARDARIVFTGATGGIGQAACELLNRAGAGLMLVGRSPAKLSALSRSLRARRSGRRESDPMARMRLDLGRVVDGLVAAARDWRCNVVVHGAGLPAFGRLESIESDVMLRVDRSQPARADDADTRVAALPAQPSRSRR